jgi:transposase
LLQPLNRRTWAPRGQRPEQQGWQRRDRLSVIASLHMSPRKRMGHFFRIHPRNVRTAEVISYLRQLHRQLGRPLIVVMDRLPAHRSALKRLQKEGVEWLTVEWLPGYAPELNPVEPLWSYSKFARLANYYHEHVDDLHDAVVEAVGDVALDQALMRSFFKSAQLRL